MSRPAEMEAFYDGWTQHQQRLVETLRPLTPEQMQLRPDPGEWPIWRLASNIAGGRLYWLCSRLHEDDRGVSIDEWGRWWDGEGQSRNADTFVDALTRTWEVATACLDRWSLADLGREVTSEDSRDQPRTITRAWVINRLLTHETFHGSEIALILRMHGLPTALAG